MLCDWMHTRSHLYFRYDIRYTRHKYIIHSLFFFIQISLIWNLWCFIILLIIFISYLISKNLIIIVNILRTLPICRFASDIVYQLINFFFPIIRYKLSPYDYLVHQFMILLVCNQTLCDVFNWCLLTNQLNAEFLEFYRVKWCINIIHVNFYFLFASPI